MTDPLAPKSLENERDAVIDECVARAIITPETADEIRGIGYPKPLRFRADNFEAVAHQVELGREEWVVTAPGHESLSLRFARKFPGGSAQHIGLVLRSVGWVELWCTYSESEPTQAQNLRRAISLLYSVPGVEACKEVEGG